MKYCLDANIFVQSWNDRYPPIVFETLYEKLKDHKDKIVIVKPIYDELKKYTNKDEEDVFNHVSEEYKECISGKLEEDCESEALTMEAKYEFDSLNSKTDVRLISYAKIKKFKVVTYETPQPQSPKKKKNYKIPLVCKIEHVQCLNFVDFLKEIKLVV